MSRGTLVHPAPMLLVLALRWLAFGWLALLALLSQQVQRPIPATVALLVTLAWTAWLTAAAPGRSATVLALDLAIAIGLVIVGGFVHTPQSVLTGHPSFAGAYPMVAVAAWAAVHQVRGGVVAGAAVGGALPLAYLANGVSLGALSALQSLSLTSAALSYLLLGAAAGVVAQQFDSLVRRAARERERAGRLAERSRLAASIHDEVLQHLGLIRRRGAELADRGPVAGVAVRTLMAELERQEHALRGVVEHPGSAPPTGIASLPKAVGDVIAGYHALPVHLVASEDIHLSQQVTDEVTAALRELLANITRHATASAVWCAVLREEDGITVHVRDDGIGFLADESTLAGRLGLRISVRERLERLGGRASIHSRPGRGTAVELWLPTTLAR